MTSHGHLRKEYQKGRLQEKEVSLHWHLGLERWVAEAAAEGIAEPNAMILATADAEGKPSARTVLMKDLTAKGVSFFTHSTSRKGRQIKEQPYAALCFSWPALERQVTLRGSVAELPLEEVEAYWASRPRESQLGSAASKQSQVAESPEEIAAALSELSGKHPGQVPRPQSWTGYRLAPEEVEFWQGGPGRMHDRIRLRQADGQWVKERLWP